MTMPATVPAGPDSPETSQSNRTAPTSATSSAANPVFRVSDDGPDISSFVTAEAEYQRQRDEIGRTCADPAEPPRLSELRAKLAAAKQVGPEAYAAVLATVTYADRALAKEWRGWVAEMREKRAAAITALDAEAPYLLIAPANRSRTLAALLGRVGEALEAAELSGYEIRVMIGRANVRTVVRTVDQLRQRNDEFPSAADVIEEMEGMQDFYEGPWGSDDAALEAGPAPNPRLAERISNAVFKYHEFEGRGMLRTTLYEQMRVRRETTQQNLQWCIRCGKVSEERGLLYPVGQDRVVLS